jgi:predicted nucleotidyltransferase
MTSTDQLLRDIKKAVSAADPEAILILYGSYARGEQRPDSDIDLLVIINRDKVTYDDRIRIGHPLYDIQLESEKLISPVIFSKTQWETKHKITSFYKNVLRDGIIL